jgi:hypothetical protein
MKVMLPHLCTSSDRSKLVVSHILTSTAVAALIRDLQFNVCGEMTEMKESCTGPSLSPAALKKIMVKIRRATLTGMETHSQSNRTGIPTATGTIAPERCVQSFCERLISIWQEVILSHVKWPASETEPNATYILIPLGSPSGERVELQLPKSEIKTLLAGVAARVSCLTSAAVECARVQFACDAGVDWLQTTLPWTPSDQSPPQPLMRYSFVQGLITSDNDVQSALTYLDMLRLAPVRHSIVAAVAEEVMVQDAQIQWILVTSLRQALNDARMMFMPPDLKFTANPKVGTHQATVSAGLCDMPKKVGTHQTNVSAEFCGMPKKVGTHQTTVSADLCDMPKKVGTHQANVSADLCDMPKKVGTHQTIVSADLCGMPGAGTHQTNVNVSADLRDMLAKAGTNPREHFACEVVSSDEAITEAYVDDYKVFGSAKSNGSTESIAGSTRSFSLGEATESDEDVEVAD